jgi:hypothetical protein
VYLAAVVAVAMKLIWLMLLAVAAAVAIDVSFCCYPLGYGGYCYGCCGYNCHCCAVLLWLLFEDVMAVAVS